MIKGFKDTLSILDTAGLARRVEKREATQKQQALKLHQQVERDEAARHFLLANNIKFLGR